MADSALFDIVILIGRPAAGKSEIIDHLKRTPEAERRHRYRIGRFEEIDDFPMIWSWFEEDHILARHGRERLHTDAEGYFTDNFFWHLLIERLEQEFWKRDKEGAGFGESRTAIVEFARGSEHGGFAEAFSHFSAELLQRSAVLYIDVPFEESLRKNRKRFNPEKPHSILEHALPDEKLRRLYGEVDWEQLPKSEDSRLLLAQARVPYTVFPNGDDVTSDDNPALGERLQHCLSQLWQTYSGASSETP